MDKPASPPAPAAPPAPSASNVRSPRATISTAIPLTISQGAVAGADRILIYGTGGIGKTTLATHLPAPLFLDLEGGTKRLNVNRDRVASWRELRGKLASIEQSPPSGMRSVVIDTATKAEEFATQHVLETRTTEKGKAVDSIEGYGWGKGWKFVHDEFIGLLADLDRLNERGILVCLISHVVSTVVPNPAGDDFMRWEPNLYAGDKRGNASIRDAVKNWCDHVLFIGYDVFVREGKATGGGTRTIYPFEMPTHVAKTRSNATATPYELNDPGAIWRALGVS